MARAARYLIRRRMTFNSRVLLALGAGLAAGAALQRADPGVAARVSDVVAPVGALWVNALLMLVMPLVLASLVLSVAGAADLSAVGRLGRRAIAYFVALVTLVAAVALLVVPPLTARLRVDDAAAASLRASVPSAAQAPEVAGAGEWFASLLPANPVRAASEGKLLPLVIFTMLFALALTQLPRARATPVVDVCAGIVGALHVLVRWILALAPIGVFALSLPLAVRFGLVAAGLLGFYLLLACALCTAMALLAFPFARAVGGVPWRQFALAAAPAYAVAFVSRSSIATLPALMEGARTRLQLPETVTTFVLPLSVTVFKYGAPITFLTGAWFLARLYGVEIPGNLLPLVFVQAVLLSFAVPGIPGGSVVTIVPILATLRIPLEGMGLLLAVDVIADMFRSSCNVGMDLAVAAAVARAAPAAAA